jgi:abhydrolase domain-containing protein 6
MGSGGPRFGRRRRRRLWRAPLWIAVLLLVAFLIAGWLRPQWFLAAEFERQRLFAGASAHSAEIDGQIWRYLEAGDGPPLVLLHGFTGSKENWLPVMAALAREHRVLAPDLPGWGYFGGEPVAPPYGYSADARRLARFIQTMAPDRHVGLVGHSMGGGIAALFAAQFPGALDRLVLMSAAGVAFDNAFARAVQAGDHPFGVADRAALQRFMGLVFADPPWVPWPVDRAMVQHRQSRIAFEREVLAAISSGPDAAAPGAMASEIGVPTLLLWCRDDQVVDLASAAVSAAAIDDTRRVVLEGCGHMPMMERPQDTAQALLDFLRRDGEG